MRIIFFIFCLSMYGCTSSSVEDFFKTEEQKQEEIRQAKRREAKLIRQAERRLRQQRLAMVSPHRRNICLALTWGPDGCGLLADFVKKEQTPDWLTAPSCTVAIAKYLKEDVSSDDLVYAASLGFVDDTSDHLIESGGFFGAIFGVALKVGSFATKQQLYEKCLLKE